MGRLQQTKVTFVQVFKENTVLIQSSQFGKQEWLLFEQPEHIVTTDSVAELMACMQRVEDYTRQGFYAAGYLAYEAAAGFDSACVTHAPYPNLPLLWFGIYTKPRHVQPEELKPTESFNVGEWQPSISESEYQQAIADIKHHLRIGDSYQVNYTFQLHSRFQGDPLSYFISLLDSQCADYCAFIDLGQHKICSLSPELFFALDGEQVLTRPMKGTRARGFYSEQDQQQRKALELSKKDQAENVMIVDMVRNDLGRFAESGSVQVDALFDIEQYPTVYQMTSTVSARSSASLSDMFTGLFPCASITGAPKIKTMSLIKKLEREPRGIYTGTIGYIAPETDGVRQAQFNVAIRTVHIDIEQGSARYGVGGGIVWDSDPELEYAECFSKAAVLTAAAPEFALLESIRWDPEQQFCLLDEHLQRLEVSAQYFGFAMDAVVIKQALDAVAKTLCLDSKVRVVLQKDSSCQVSAEVLQAFDSRTIALASSAVNTNTPFFYHKTTHRSGYDEALALVSDCDDVILFNTQGEVTESTIANIVIATDSGLLTPPQSVGLLNGVFRQRLLDQGLVKEAVLTQADIAAAETLYLVNSVRGWMRVEKTGQQQWQVHELGYEFEPPSLNG